jgi:hypothetical protein
MEVVHLINNTYQVINLSDNSVLFQGSYDECLAYEEHMLYKMFMSMGNF